MIQRQFARLAALLESARREEGQTMTEYAIVLTLIAVGLVLAIGQLRDAITTVITAAAGAV